MIAENDLFRFKKHFRKFTARAGFLLVLISIVAANAYTQSTNQNAPTPLTTDEIRGQIKARDIGDPRLTAFYYIFNGERGDVFINVVTTNLNGDIDIFTASNLQPRTKITVYADSAVTETGRIVYMRQPEKLLLRVQGRTPNDEPATFQIKFAGSFKPLPASSVAEVPDLPDLEINREGTVKVNSVGTIIEEPKPETEKKTKTEIDRDRIAETETKDRSNIPEKFDPTKKPEKILPEDPSILNPQVVITDKLGAEAEKKAETENAERDVTLNLEEKTEETSAVVRIEKVDENEETEEKSAEESRLLSKISLKVKLKNGGNFERIMSEVLSINVIKTVLTIVTSDGKIHEFSIFDVERMTID